MYKNGVHLWGRNNAGIEGHFAAIEATPEDEFDKVIEINLKGVWLSAKYEIEQFKKQGTGGAIVNTSSWLARGAAASFITGESILVDGGLAIGGQRG